MEAVEKEAAEIDASRRARDEAKSVLTRLREILENEEALTFDAKRRAVELVESVEVVGGMKDTVVVTFRFEEHLTPYQNWARAMMGRTNSVCLSQRDTRMRGPSRPM